MISPLLFWIFATFAVVASIALVATKNPVRSALALVGAFLCVAAFYILLSAQFIAAVQVIVYAGAIMVLFLFVIMLLNLGAPQALRERGTIQPPIAIALGVIFIWALLNSGSLFGLTQAVPPASAQVFVAQGTVEGIGNALYNPAQPWLFPFEVTSILLLVAIVGSIIMAKRRI
jgi:NADH-quinone oxidoreductase subunit J